MCVIYFCAVMCSVGFDIVSNCSVHGHGLFKVAKAVSKSYLKFNSILKKSIKNILKCTNPFIDCACLLFIYCRA